ncbi:hypothetical protein PUN28_013290 [Cardiocondyla obscurior]|uniref:Uncharacterized protein n=1 Tax=Cardiocondyla obscurior TaxID=286306 RepID=A0AAW2FBT2_9HYME
MRYAGHVLRASGFETDIEASCACSLTNYQHVPVSRLALKLYEPRSLAQDTVVVHLPMFDRTLTDNILPSKEDRPDIPQTS